MDKSCDGSEVDTSFRGQVKYNSPARNKTCIWVIPFIQCKPRPMIVFSFKIQSKLAWLCLKLTKSQGRNNDFLHYKNGKESTGIDKSCGGSKVDTSLEAR